MYRLSDGNSCNIKKKRKKAMGDKKFENICVCKFYIAKEGLIEKVTLEQRLEDKGTACV